MSDISKSPSRFSFDRDNYLRVCKEKNIEPLTEYLDTINETIENHLHRFDEPKSQEHNLEYDLLTTEWVLIKVRNSQIYAQNLYAAMCNNTFVKNDIWPILQEKEWSCSWRHAGGIIADMRQEGDYMDWYCSGKQRDRSKLADPTPGYVAEEVVTEEIENDLKRLNWIIKKNK